jgi:hypothetical protein
MSAQIGIDVLSVHLPQFRTLAPRFSRKSRKLHVSALPRRARGEEHDRSAPPCIRGWIALPFNLATRNEKVEARTARRSRTARDDPL